MEGELAALASSEEVVGALKQHVSTLVGERKRFELTSAALEVSSTNVRAMLEEERKLNAGLTNVRAKLEALCRELQKQNKLIEGESDKRQLAEHQKRIDLQASFDVTIADVKRQIQGEEDSKSHMKAEYARIQGKLNDFLEM